MYAKSLLSLLIFVAKHLPYLKMRNIPVLTFSLAGLYIAKEDSVTVSCDAFTQSAERATVEMRTSSMLPGKMREVPPSPPPNISGTVELLNEVRVSSCLPTSSPLK